MSSRASRAVVGPLALALVAGCASTQPAAPVREVGRGPLPAAAMPAPAPAGYYRVQPGDTLYKIAFENGQDYRDLADWNGLPDPDRIRVGGLLRLKPPPESVKTNPLPAAARYRATPLETVPLPAVERPATERAAAAPEAWVWPARGPLLKAYDPAGNKGIDIAGSLGTPVQAAAPGRVVYAGDGLRGYGKLIIIKHDQTLLSAYAHQSRVLVKEGQMVARGQKIGEMGDSDADRVKLHFEIRMHGQPVDPLKYLPKAG